MWQERFHIDATLLPGELQLVDRQGKAFRTQHPRTNILQGVKGKPNTLQHLFPVETHEADKLGRVQCATAVKIHPRVQSPDLIDAGSMALKA
eukprot:Skav209399  [mRNA]  locus=scaffold962:108751:110092:+ [translate_table: standard]